MSIGAPMAVANRQIEMPSLAHHKTRFDSIIKCCGIFAKCFTYIFSLSDIRNKKIYYLSDSTKSE